MYLSQLNLASAGVLLAQMALVKAHCFAPWPGLLRQTLAKSLSLHTVQWLGISRKNQSVVLMNQFVHTLRVAPELPLPLMLSTPPQQQWLPAMLMPEMHIRSRLIRG
jgi:hypothetical protein